MQGLHAQLTTTELTSALDATETLLKLEPYIDRPTYTKISTLHADLTTEQEDRQRIAGANSRWSTSAHVASPPTTNYGSSPIEPGIFSEVTARLSGVITISAG
jgi:hypothetical protein